MLRSDPVAAALRSRPRVAGSLLALALVALACTSATGMPGVGSGMGSPPSSPSGSAAASPTPSPSPGLLLPDLRVGPPRELHITRDPRTGDRQIRFSTAVTNLGEGPLELSGEHDPIERRTVASQRIRRFDGGTDARVAGVFVFHPAHDHWHFEDFTSFELWTHDGDGELTRLVATTGKMSFCVWDSDPMADPPPEAPSRRAYERCPQDIQGLSIGWMDVYSARTPGQHLTIEGVPDGAYAIRSTVDPVDRLIESDEGNNDAIVYVRLSGSQIQRVSRPGR